MAGRTRVMWFRRDLRLGDHPALAAALDGPGPVVPLFVIDPALWGPAGAVRRACLVDALTALDDSLGGMLHVRTGDPRVVVPALARDVEADQVHLSADFGPYGARRDTEVEAALARSGATL